MDCLQTAPARPGHYARAALQSGQPTDCFANCPARQTTGSSQSAVDTAHRYRERDGCLAVYSGMDTLSNSAHRLSPGTQPHSAHASYWQKGRIHWRCEMDPE